VTPGETWVPLVEKAWAKLHGDYASVMFGRTCDAIEDMTGYVFENLSLSTFFFFIYKICKKNFFLYLEGFLVLF
jgi:Calpain family cysteine protease